MSEVAVSRVQGGLQLPPSPGTTSIEAAESRAKRFGLYADTWARLVMVLVVSLIFIGLNYKVMGFIEKVFDSDIAGMKAVPTYHRVVTTELLMSLVAATVVQVGVAVIAIVSYLFPKNRSGGRDSLP